MDNMSSQELENWADELLAEYKDGRRDLARLKSKLEPELLEDKSKINSMISDMSFSIDWMTKGRQPDLYRGVDRKNAYRAKRYEDMDIIPDMNEESRKELESLYMSQGQRTALLQLFYSFSDRERQCYIMHAAEGLSMQKIADRLGLSKWTVRTYIDRAKEKVEEITAA